MMRWLLKNQSAFDVLLEISSFIEANLLWSMSSRLVVFSTFDVFALLFCIRWLTMNAFGFFCLGAF